MSFLSYSTDIYILYTYICKLYMIYVKLQLLNNKVYMCTMCLFIWIIVFSILYIILYISTLYTHICKRYITCVKLQQLSSRYAYIYHTSILMYNCNLINVFNRDCVPYITLQILMFCIHIYVSYTLVKLHRLTTRYV
jgi:hypothetical protein